MPSTPDADLPVTADLVMAVGSIRYMYKLDAAKPLAEITPGTPAEAWNRTPPGGFVFPKEFRPEQLNVEFEMTARSPALDVRTVTIVGSMPDRSWLSYMLHVKDMEEDQDPPRLHMAPLWVRHGVDLVFVQAMRTMVNPAMAANDLAAYVDPDPIGTDEQVLP